MPPSFHFLVKLVHVLLSVDIQIFYSRLENVADTEKEEYPGKFIPELRLIHTDIGGHTKV